MQRNPDAGDRKEKCPLAKYEALKYQAISEDDDLLRNEKV